MAKLTTIYWRDIPAQVIGQQGRKRHKQELSKRFAVGIDRAAITRAAEAAYAMEFIDQLPEGMEHLKPFLH